MSVSSVASELAQESYFFFFFFFGSRSNSGEGGWQTILEQPCDLCIAIVIVVITTVSL